MKHFYLDIETEPNPKLIDLFMAGIKAPKTYKDELKIAEYIDKKKGDMIKGMSVDVDFCVIKCIGYKEDDEPAKIVTLEWLVDRFRKELAVQAETVGEFKAKHFFKVITFNGKKFDIPVIIRECIRQKIDAPLLHFHQWTVKHNNNYSVDLMNLLGDGSFRTLDLYSKIYLDWPKKDIDFTTCTVEELHAHCIDDVEMTAELAKIFEKLYSFDEVIRY